MAHDDLDQLKIDKTAIEPRTGTSRNRRYWIAGIVLVALAAGLFFSGLLRPAATVEIVSVQQTYPSQGFTLLNASGYVVAQRKAAVASKATGRLIWLGVEEGSIVREGQVLARIENDDVLAGQDQAAANLNSIRTTLDQAKAELHDAELSFKRFKALLAEGIVSAADFDAAQARYRRARAAVAGAEANIRAASAALDAARVAVEFTQIRAPFDAVVLTKNADVGDIVTPLGAAADAKAAVVTIADMASLQAEVDVSESNLEKVRVKQPCEIQLDAFPDLRFRGLVHMVVPTADRSKATVLVKVKFLDIDKRILPEMSAKVAFLSRPVAKAEEQPRTTVNPEAVVERDGRKVVFLVKDNRVVETPVKLGNKVGDLEEVISGVKAGDSVVLRPADKLRDGSRISIPEK
ncbi:MAG: efflux RND transporter periplasmic adaptor subunit [Deltaproteobacteria bacterium]|nr:efflux RND transporter periplasmic adaptor subunit [Deltaproteobacteria bacterium]TLN02117.1 MAG: efflux RND transporter periplasmic adaptor subunit [bacterium]